MGAQVVNPLLNCVISHDGQVLASEQRKEEIMQWNVDESRASRSNPLHVPSHVDYLMHCVVTLFSSPGNRQLLQSGDVESELVRELRSLGTILYCKTSVPVTLMAGETANHIIHYTWNPKNRLLSAGGSSGGEGALIALRGSPAGFGTDIGGSVRILAAFNSIFGLRPSSGRMPYQGAANSMDGQNIILSVIGPIAPTLRALKLIFQAVLSKKPWYFDPLVLEIPWRDDIEKKTRELTRASSDEPSKLAFAILRHDGVVKPHPPVKRGLDIVEQTIQRLGHKVIEWNPPEHELAYEIADGAYDLDGGHDLSKNIGLSGEAPIPQCIVQNGPQKQASEAALLNVQKRNYQKEYLDYWQSTAEVTGTGRPVDGLFCPAAPHAAVLPEKYRHTGYTTFVNVLDYTSLVIPVTEVIKTVDTAQPTDSFLTEKDKQVHSEYDADAYDGAPVGVQLVGRRLDEERILTLAEYICENLP